MTNTNNISLYARCNQQAEVENARKWDQIRHEQTLGVLECNGHQRVKELGNHWWQNKALWAYRGGYVSITEQDAIMGIFRECGGTYSDLADLTNYEIAAHLMKEVIEEEQITRYYQHQLPLPELLAVRGETLEWVLLNPTDKEPMRFEVPLVRAG